MEVRRRRVRCGSEAGRNGGREGRRGREKEEEWKEERIRKGGGRERKKG